MWSYILNESADIPTLLGVSIADVRRDPVRARGTG